MTKGKWLSRALHVTIALSFVLGALVVAPSVSADPGTSKWEKQGTPTEDDKVILPGSDIIDFDIAGDGETIYAIGTLNQVNCTTTSWSSFMGPYDLMDKYQLPKLWKSTDGGVTWSDKTSKVTGATNLPKEGATAGDWDDFTFISNVSVAPDDPEFVVVAGWCYDTSNLDGTARNYLPVVVGSNDGADKFYYMGCGTAVGLPTALDVSMEVDGEHCVALGTWDWEECSNDNGDSYDSAFNGEVWRFDAGSYWSASWVNTSGYDGWKDSHVIVDLEFSPNFDVDDGIVVLSIGDVNDVEWDCGDDTLTDPQLDGPDTDAIPDYAAYMIQAGAWNSIDAWNSFAEFDSYPVEIKNDDYVIVALTDPDLDNAYLDTCFSWDSMGSMIRNAGDIDLPFDYMADDTSDRKFMVAVNGFEWNITSDEDEMVDDGGFLFWVENTSVSLELLDHEDNPYIASIDYNGNIDMEGRTLVGLGFPASWRYPEINAWTCAPDALASALPVCVGVPVLYSETTDVCCPDWDWSCKPPSGQYNATVMMNPDGDMAYAGTMGDSYQTTYVGVGEWCDESAFSRSGDVEDVGKAWNQMSLIDTDIDFIADVAVTSNGDGDDECSPSCACIYIATINSAEGDARALSENKVAECDSIWRSCDGGGTWLRIWHKALAGAVMDPVDAFDWPYGVKASSGPSVEWMKLGLVPGEEEPETIYMADLGTETIYVAQDEGACCPAGLGCWTDRNTALGMWKGSTTASTKDWGIADIAVLDTNTIYVMAFNNDMVKSTTMGRHWSSQEDTKVADDDGELAHDIIAWGDWVVCGGDKGTVSYSDDGGDSFSILDDIGKGQVHVAFDSYFDDNGYIYAAIADESMTDSGVYRTTIDGADFKDMGACDDLNYWGVIVSDPDGNPMTSASSGGVLYASYNGSEDCADSGVARILDPASQNCCGSLYWDYLFESLWTAAQFTTQATDIALCGDASGGATTIYAIDIAGYVSGGPGGNTWYSHTTGAGGYYWGWDACYTEFAVSDVGRLWKFNDVFAKGAPELIGVEDGATIPSDPCDCVNEDFILEWDRLCDACEYDVEIALDEGFKHKVWTVSMMVDDGWFVDSCHDNCDGILGTDCVDDDCQNEHCFYKPSDPCAPSLVVPQGVLDCNQTYWWRVRARYAETGEAYRSWWSDKWSFTVAVGPDGAIKLTAPVNGAMNVPLGSVVFTWTAVADATSYEMVLMDASGAEIGSNSGDATSFVLTSDLDYDSAYMWMVKAMKGSNVLSESGVSTFHTMSKPVPPPEYPETVINFPEPAPTPTWVWVVIALAAILIIVVIVLIFRTRRV